MNGEGEVRKPWLSHVASWLALASSTLLYPFINGASSSTTVPAHEPQNQSPSDESTQGGSDQPPRPRIPLADRTLQLVEFQADIEALNDLVLASPTSLNPFSQASTPSPWDDFNDQPHCEPIKSSNIDLQLHPNTQPHHQFHTSPYYNPIRSSFSSSISSEEPSHFSSSPTSSKEPSPTYSPPKHSPKSPNRKADQARVTLITSERKPESGEPILHAMEIIDKLELGKHIMISTMPIGMALVLSTSFLAVTFEMQVVASAFSCGFAATWNGVLLRKTYPKASPVILIAGISLINFAFFASVICFLPLKLKWIPALSWLATLFPLATFLIAFVRRAGEEKDPEKGQSY